MMSGVLHADPLRRMQHRGAICEVPCTRRNKFGNNGKIRESRYPRISIHIRSLYEICGDQRIYR